MALVRRRVVHTVLDSSGQPVSARVLITLLGADAGYSADGTVSGTLEFTSDPATGKWSADLVANDTLTPTGTRYTVTETIDREVVSHIINVTQALAAPSTEHDVLDLLADAPAALASGALTAHLADTADAHDASAISILDTAADFTATDVEGALAELQSDAEAHLADTSDAHDASAVSFVPAGTIAATTVQAAIEEVATEASSSGVTDHLADTVDAHDASAVSFVPAGTIAATDVQAAIVEVAAEASVSDNGPLILKPTGAVRETFPRTGVTNQAVMDTLQGYLVMSAIPLFAGDVVSNITLVSGTLALNAPTNQFFGLYSGALAKLAESANDTTTAWAANVPKTLAMTTPYAVTTSGLYYVAFMYTGTGGNAIVNSTNNGVYGAHVLAPKLCGWSTSGLTTSIPATAGTIDGIRDYRFYAYVS